MLNQAGVRIMRLDGVTTIGMWSDLDGAELREALRILGLDRLMVRYLDARGIPLRYKLRRVEGEPVPMSVLVQMELHPDEPWKIRDLLLLEMGCDEDLSDNGYRSVVSLEE